MNYGKLTAGTTKTAIDTAKPSEKGEIITYLSRMGDVLEQVFKRNEITENFFRILILSHRNVPNALFREYELKVVIHHDVFTPKPAEILCDHAVDFPEFDILHHTPEIWTLEICTAPSIVHVFVHDMQTVILCILL
jgi:hypothetical protein